MSYFAAGGSTGFFLAPALATPALDAWGLDATAGFNRITNTYSETMTPLMSFNGLNMSYDRSVRDFPVFTITNGVDITNPARLTLSTITRNQCDSRNLGYNLTGNALAEGLALGHVILHEPRVVITNVIADDVQKERERLEKALTTLRADLDTMLERGDMADGGEHREVLEAYRMFAHDRGWVHKLEEALLTGLTAEAAVERVQSDTRARMLRQTDPYLRERLHDLEDLAYRLLRQLLGHTSGLPDFHRE